MEKKIDECEITIIGGGAVGCFIAYYLSQRSKSIALVERQDFSSGASGATSAVLMAQARKAGPQLVLAMKSSRIWERLAFELDYDIEYVRKGSMIVMETEEEVEFVKKYTRAQVEFGLPLEFLNSAEMLKAQPALSHHILAASFCPTDGEVNPFRVVFGLLRVVRRNGVRIYNHTTVKGFDLDDKRIVNVVTDKGIIKTSVVICGAGAYSPHIGHMLGIDIPIRPQRGQILVTEAIEPLITSPLYAASAMIAKQKAFSGSEGKKTDEFVLGMIISQTVNGNMIVGTTNEFVGYDTSTSLKGLRSIAAYTSSIIPALSSLNVIRTFSGLRPSTDTGSIIIGPDARISNFIVVAGQNGGGLTSSPATGQEVAQKLCDGTWPY